MAAMLKASGFTFSETAYVLTQRFDHGKGTENTERDLLRCWERSEYTAVAGSVRAWINGLYTTEEAAQTVGLDPVEFSGLDAYSILARGIDPTSRPPDFVFGPRRPDGDQNPSGYSGLRRKTPTPGGPGLPPQQDFETIPDYLAGCARVTSYQPLPLLRYQFISYRECINAPDAIAIFPRWRGAHQRAIGF